MLIDQVDDAKHVNLTWVIWKPSKCLTACPIKLIKLEIDANHFLAASIDRSVCQLLHAKEAKIGKVIMKYYLRKGPETGLSCDQELFITFQIEGMLLTPLPIPRYILHRRYQNCYNLSVSLQFSFNLLEDNFICKGWELSILLSKTLSVVLLSLF